MSKVVLIDLSSIFHRHWHVTETEGMGEALKRTVNDVYRMAEGYDGVGVCVDAPPYLRTERYKDYKGNRQKPDGNLYGQLDATVQRLEDEGFAILKAQGHEADDCIATCCKVLDGHLTIYSSDKDLMQLVRQGVEVISVGTGQAYDATAVWEKFGVFPKQIPDVLALLGDKSDNIPGVRGVGVKTAAEMLELNGGTLEGVIDAAAKGNLLPVPKGKDVNRFQTTIQEDREAILEWRELIRLVDDVPIDPQWVFKERVAKNQTTPEELDIMNEPEIVDAMPTEEQAKEKRARIVDEGEKPTHPPEVGALTPRPAPTVEWAKSLEPTDARMAWGVSIMLFESKLFGQFPNHQAVLAIMMTGRSRGLDAVTSLLTYHIIKGKPCPHASLIVAWAKNHPKCEYFRLVESTNTSATWETKHADEPEPTRETYTIDDAKMAGLAGGDNYKKRPRVMLRWRAATDLARVVYPDVVAGIYSVEEMAD